MITDSQINSHIVSLKTEISQISSVILHDFPIATYIHIIKCEPELLLYREFNPKLTRMFETVQSNFGDHALALYHKLALASFIKESLVELEHQHLPGHLLQPYFDWFRRIMDDFSREPDDFYDHNKDLFCKDLGVCSMRILPMGSFLIEISGIGKRLFFTGDFRQLFNYLKYTLFKTKGFKPFYSYHMDQRYLKEFNPEGWDQCYLQIAEMLKLNPRIKGTFGVTWFFDPQLEQISPRLSYLRKRPERRGAKIFRVGSSDSDVRLSIMKSPTRRRLYKEGKYKPTGYMLVWPRQDLIAWADQHRKTIEERVTESRIDEIIATWTEEISQTSHDILSNFPIETYIETVKSYRKLHFYRNSSPQLVAVFENILASHGRSSLAGYQKLAMAHFIKNSIQEMEGMKLPMEVFRLYHSWFHRIINDFSKQPAEFYDYKLDLFCKDLAVCSLRLIPVGFLIEQSGIGARFLVSGGKSQFINSTGYLISKMHGLRPFYSIHLDMRYLRPYFSKSGWIYNYLNIADMLKANPEMKGLIGGSWFYDPQMDQISPSLSHLRTLPVQYGGKAYQSTTTEQDWRLAAANSPQRTKLILEGKYKPVHYVIIWPRKGMLQWAEEHRKAQLEKQNENRSN